MLKLCNYPSCSRFRVKDKKYCLKHVRNERVPFSGAKRGVSQQYQNYYQTPEWKQRRTAQLKAFPFCSKCGRKDDLLADHIEPHRGDWIAFLNNPLQTECRSCHSKKTIRETNRHRRAKTI
jgi:5-methylcytosine-specific restriction endonuclease McrA